MVSPPDWLSLFANAVSQNIHSHDVLSPLGCHFHQANDVWEVTIFASRTEIVGGPEDGRSSHSRFNVDVKAVVDLFSRIEAVTWQTHPMGEFDELGSHFSVEGEHAGQQVCLRITAIPPERFDAGRRALVNHQEFEEVW